MALAGQSCRSRLRPAIPSGGQSPLLQKTERSTTNCRCAPRKGAPRKGLTLIEEYKDGVLLDCGAGKRPVYYENVVNYEIANYDSTDVIGVAEELPFIDYAFDAVISVAVLEHVRDPFRAAREISRVLRPGGKLFCCVPFLQPFHAYPNHYYNMTHVGLANLVRDLRVLQQAVYASTGPIHTLTWFLRNWKAGLRGQTAEDFLDMRVRDLIDDPWSYVNMLFVTELTEKTNFEIASATVLLAVKENVPAPRTNPPFDWLKGIFLRKPSMSTGA